MRRVAVVTGASSGIGRQAAKALAADGWRVIAVGRDAARSTAAEAEIRAAVPDAALTMIRADLAIMADVVRLVGEIAALTDRIDVLLNNAGGMTSRHVITAEGLEENFAGNHLGPFLLTERLLPLLRRAAADAPARSVRIINTSSNGSEMIPGLKWGDLQLDEGFTPGAAYCQGKLANVLHARGLATRLAGDGIVAHAVHPGVVASNFIAHVEESTRAYMRGLDAETPEQAAQALVWLATADAAGHGSGGYFHGRTPAAANPVADDPVMVDRLWRESEALVAPWRA